MWSEKREIESGEFLAIVPILINIFSNGIYFFNNGSYESLQTVKDFNMFTIFTIIACIVMNIFTQKSQLSEEEKLQVNKDMKEYKLLNIVFIAYIVIAAFIIKELNVLCSAAIMEASYINYCTIKKNAKSVRGSEAKENWNKVYNNGYTEDGGNILWRIKPMMFPIVKVKFSERLKTIRWVNVFSF